MKNANTFIIYADGTGNVTLSPRHSRGNVMPVYDSTIDAELLAGSGVQNGIMTANIRCGNCQSWATDGSMDFSASSGGWIHARATGDPMDTTNVEERIKFHSAFGAFTWPFTQAIGGASTNPFQDPSLASNPATAQTPRHMKPIVLWCHGVFAATAFALFFPLGAILIRVATFPGIMWVHAAIQMFAWALFATAFGLGLYFGIIRDILNKTHPIIGIVLFGMMTIQPLSGWIHHRRYVKTGARSASSYAHVWIGRVAVVLGMINGGLGLMWARRFQRTYVIVYSVFAGIMGIAYLAAIGYGEMMRKKRRGSSSGSVEAPGQEKSTTARSSWGSRHSAGSAVGKSRNDSV